MATKVKINEATREKLRRSAKKQWRNHAIRKKMVRGIRKAAKE